MHFRNRRRQLLEPAALRRQIALLLDAQLLLLQVAVLRDECLVDQVLEVLHPLPRDRRRLFQLANDLLRRHQLGLAAENIGVNAHQSGLILVVLSVDNPLLLCLALDRHARQPVENRRSA